jgi:Vibrio cholerae sialidase, lectin insertion
MKLINAYRHACVFTLAAVWALLCLVPRAHAQLPNAWQITDSSTATGTPGAQRYYTSTLTTDQRIAATNSTGGFHFTMVSRLVDDLGGPQTMLMAYGLGDKRFLIWLNLNGSSNLTANLDQAGTYALTTGANDATSYHVHEIIYDPATGTARYLFDGQLISNNWSASSFTLPAGEVRWGASAGSGRGQMNFHSVDFAITNSVVFSYDAGTAGNPAIAPDPTNSVPAWILVAGAGTASTNVSPDGVRMLQFRGQRR